MGLLEKDLLLSYLSPPIHNNSIEKLFGYWKPPIEFRIFCHSSISCFSLMAELKYLCGVNVAGVIGPSMHVAMCLWRKITMS